MQLRAAPVLCSRWMPLVLDVINFWVVESCMYWCRRPLRGGLFAHVLWVGDRLGRAAAAAGPISGVLCCSAAGLAEEWIRALRMSSTRVSQPGGFSPASDLGRRSVLRRTVGSRWRHSRRHTSPLCRPEAATTAAYRAAADRVAADRAADTLASAASPFAFSGSSSVEPLGATPAGWRAVRPGRRAGCWWA